jgi:hypothetical protein
MAGEKKQTTTVKSGTAVIRCDCRHPYQDRVYGAGRRLGNFTKSMKGERRQARCTVCSKLQDA